MNVLLKCVTRQSPPHETSFVSTPEETDGSPGPIQASTLASQVPATSLKIACSGPGLTGGGPCWAEAEAAKASRITEQARAFTATSLRVAGAESGPRAESKARPARAIRNLDVAGPRPG